MFPIRDHNPSAVTPIVTYALIAANVVVFLTSWDRLADPRSLQVFFFDWALIPAAVTQGVHLHTFLTSMFLHGGVLHLAGNMLFLYVFGDNLEEALGRLGFLGFYLAGGVAAGVAQVAVAPLSQVPTVGASGAVAGVMGGYLLLFPRARVDILVILVIIIRIIPVPAWAMLGLWFAFQLGQGLVDDGVGGGVAYWAHTGGFVAGLVMILPVWLRRGGPASWRRLGGKPPHPGAVSRRSSVPAVRRRR